MKRITIIGKPPHDLQEGPEVAIKRPTGLLERAFNKMTLDLDQFGEVRCDREERLLTFDPVLKMHAILQGRGEVVIEGVRFPLSSGKIYFIGPGATEIRSPAGMVKYYLRFHLRYEGLDLLRGLRVSEVPMPADLPPFTAPGILPIKGLVYTALGRSQHLLGLLHSDLASLSGFESYIRWLHENLGDPQALQTAVTPRGLTRPYFAQQFRRRFGLTPKAYQTRLRVERAKALLVQGSQDLENLAAHLGFEDRSHLGKTFKKQVGMSLGAFRGLYARGENSHFLPASPPFGLDNAR